MKKNKTFLECILIIVKHKVLTLLDTNIRCWLGYKYENISFNPNIKKCKRCGKSTLFINAIYEDN